MTAATLLVELLTEELPPKALPRLGETFATKIAEGLKARGLAPADAPFRTFASPRRLAVTVAQVASEAAAKEVTEKLMPVSVALDAEDRRQPLLAAYRVDALLGGISGVDAYHRATDRLNAQTPSCEMDWTLLAGIGQVESNQGRGLFDPHGNTLGRILGPRLDGSMPGTAVITDTDGGRFDGDHQFDRAVGPVQFIPSTWAVLGRDGNDDSVADPNNIYDGALAAATLLCDQGGSMGDPAARTRAVLAYNNSLAYVANVNAWAHGYAVNAYPLPADLPEIHRPEPTVEPPAHCPEGWEGDPTAAPAPAVPGEPAPPVPGCTEATPPSTPPGASPA